MDDIVDSPDELAENLRDIEWTNRRLGGTAPVVSEVFARAATSVLDVGCGSADIARALRAEATRRGRDLAITALDRSEQMLAIARQRTPQEDAVTFVCGDGTALPYSTGAFDLVTCNLALHHFAPADAVTLLRELRRVARAAPLVCDLRRSPLAYAATLAWTRVFTTNRLTRHDAPLSVRRAYTPKEARALASDAGWTRPVARPYPFFRMVLVDEG